MYEMPFVSHGCIAYSMHAIKDRRLNGCVCFIASCYSGLSVLCWETRARVCRPEIEMFWVSECLFHESIRTCWVNWTSCLVFPSSLFGYLEISNIVYTCHFHLWIQSRAPGSVCVDKFSSTSWEIRTTTCQTQVLASPIACFLIQIFSLFSCASLQITLLVREIRLNNDTVPTLLSNNSPDGCFWR